jgi:hypothetical protein
MKRLLCLLATLVSVVSANAVEYMVGASTSGTAFTSTVNFAANPANTTYKLVLTSMMTAQAGTNTYTYTTIPSAPTIAGLSPSWTHNTSTLSTGVVVDYWTTTLTGLTAGTTYTVTVSGTGKLVGGTGIVGCIPFNFYISAN